MIHRGPDPSTTAHSPPLPTPRGPLSSQVIEALQDRHTERIFPTPRECGGVEPYGDDLQLALYCCYELHYRGFNGVSDSLEWDPGLLKLRRTLESSFLTALRADVPPGHDVWAEVDHLLVEPVGPGA